MRWTDEIAVYTGGNVQIPKARNLQMCKTVLSKGKIAAPWRQADFSFYWIQFLQGKDCLQSLLLSAILLILRFYLWSFCLNVLFLWSSDLELWSVRMSLNRLQTWTEVLWVFLPIIEHGSSNAWAKNLSPYCSQIDVWQWVDQMATWSSSRFSFLTQSFELSITLSNLWDLWVFARQPLQLKTLTPRDNSSSCTNRRVSSKGTDTISPSFAPQTGYLWSITFCSRFRGPLCQPLSLSLSLSLSEKSDQQWKLCLVVAFSQWAYGPNALRNQSFTGANVY
jgi:hypothetical protein